MLVMKRWRWCWANYWWLNQSILLRSQWYWWGEDIYDAGDEKMMLTLSQGSGWRKLMVIKPINSFAITMRREYLIDIIYDAGDEKITMMLSWHELMVIKPINWCRMPRPSNWWKLPLTTQSASIANLNFAENYFLLQLYPQHTYTCFLHFRYLHTSNTHLLPTFQIPASYITHTFLLHYTHLPSTYTFLFLHTPLLSSWFWWIWWWLIMNHDPNQIPGVWLCVHPVPVEPIWLWLYNYIIIIMIIITWSISRCPA